MRKKAPSFKLPDQQGILRSLKDYRGRWVVLYFYPKDESLNCTRQACEFRDEYRIISQFGNAEIIGINKSSVESHKKFSKNHNLNFPILSDKDHKVTKAYGAWRGSQAKLFGERYATRRNTYLIDPMGYIVKIYRNVNARKHADEVIGDLQEMQDKLVKSS